MLIKKDLVAIHNCVGVIKCRNSKCIR